MSSFNEPPTPQEWSKGLKFTSSQYHRLAFTWYNVNDERPPQVVYAGLYQYLTYQLERCPRTGTLHFQGYVEFKDGYKPRLRTIYDLNPFGYEELVGYCEDDDTEVWEVIPDERFRELKKEYADDVHQVARCYTGAWIKFCWAGAKKNIKYCHKKESRVEGDEAIFFEDGTPKKATAGDIVELDKDEAWQMLANGTFDKHATWRHKVFWARNQQTIAVLDRMRYEQHVAEKDFSNTTFYFIWGGTGSGKTIGATYGIWEGADCVDYYDKRDDRGVFLVDDIQERTGKPWMCAYNGEERIVIDEIDKNYISLDFLIQATAEEPHKFHGKRVSGGVLRNWTEVFITSNVAPSELWEDPKYDCLKRRITQIVHLTEAVSEEIVEARNMKWSEMEKTAGRIHVDFGKAQAKSDNPLEARDRYNRASAEKINHDREQRRLRALYQQVQARDAKLLKPTISKSEMKATKARVQFDAESLAQDTADKVDLSDRACKARVKHIKRANAPKPERPSPVSKPPLTPEQKATILQDFSPPTPTSSPPSVQDPIIPMVGGLDSLLMARRLPPAPDTSLDQVS